MATAQSRPLAGGASIPASHWDGDMAADIFAPEGTPWLAVFDGIARAADYSLGGHTVTLTATDGTQAYYAHGQAGGRASGPVNAGQVIGTVSDSGNAKGTGPHLHFAVGQINDNGGGTIAPSDFFSGTDRAPATTPGPASSVGPGSRRGLWMIAGAAILALLIAD